MQADDSARRRSIAFLNWAHALDHFVLLIYPTVVIGLEVIYQRPYAELIALSTAAFVAFGVFSLPAGWLADRWSRRNMMAAFYIGCGVSLIGVAAAPNLVVLAVALFALGVFAAIYHPVGMPMLLEASKAQGRTVAFNGVCGNLGAALAAGVAAAIASWLGWRAAFLVPALVCIATGIAYVMLVPDDRHRTASRKKTADVVLSQRAALIMFGLYVVISLAGGLTFNTISIALPKIVDERLGADVPLLWVGSVATAVFMCGAVAQIVVGRLVEWIRPYQLFAVIVAAAIPRHRVGGQCERHDADPGARRHHGGDLRAGDGRRPGDRALHRRCLARPRLCGALFPHLRVVGRGGVDHRLAVQPRRLRPAAAGGRRHCRGVPGRRAGHRVPGLGR